jgi:hypothetical protein
MAEHGVGAGRWHHRALWSQWTETYDVFGVWVVDVPDLVGSLTVGFQHVQDVAMNALCRRGNESVLLKARHLTWSMDAILP